MHSMQCCQKFSVNLILVILVSVSSKASSQTQDNDKSTLSSSTDLIGSSVILNTNTATPFKGNPTSETSTLSLSSHSSTIHTEPPPSPSAVSPPLSHSSLPTTVTRSQATDHQAGTTRSPPVSPSSLVTEATRLSHTTEDQITITGSPPVSHSSLATEASRPSHTTDHQTVTTGLSLITNSSSPFTTQSLEGRLSYSEKVFTTIIGALLGMVGLAMLASVFSTWRKKRNLFVHQPLYNDNEEMVNRFAPSDDILVISGGLYDGPQIFSSPEETSGYEEFTTVPPQLRLQFFKEDWEQLPASEI